MHEPGIITVNGVEQPVDVPPEWSLLGFLRERLGLTGAKGGCGEGVCGACTVLVDGRPVRSCVTRVGEAAGRQLLTIEGLAGDGQLHPLQQAILDEDAFQCGFCTPGMIMAGVALLAQHPDPDEATIVAALDGNICRCGMYARIVRAVRRAAAHAHGGDQQG